MRLTLTTPTKRYPIVIAPQAIMQFPWPQSAVVLCDAVMLPHIKKIFKQQPIIVVPTGERHKRLATVEWICDQLIALGCDRRTAIIGVGGGVIGDMAGLVANLFMRGVRLYHVPTTLLAMVDSSIGGKNGVDLPTGKNLVGTVYQPEAVIIDPTFLQQLPAEQFSNGMGEVVKHGVLDQHLFTWLERNRLAIQQRRLAVLQMMIKLNVQIKIAIVQKDEREHHERMLLNLGHTFGHAFELLSDYTLPHGQAVAIGLAYATAYSKLPERNRVLSLLTEFGLPTSLKQPFKPEAIVQAMLADKKHQGQHITLVLPEQIGHIHIERAVTAASMLKFLRQYQA